MPKENTTRYILLGLLSHESLSGYDLKKRIDLGVSQFWSVGYAQIYPTLTQLAREGHVTWQAVPGGKGPERKVYAITPAGREALRAWLLVPEEKEYVRYEILLKLFFSSGVDVSVSRERIRAFAARQERELQLMRAYRENLESVLTQSEDHRYFYLTVLFGEQVYSGYLQWAEQALALLTEPGETVAITERKDPS